MEKDKGGSTMKNGKPIDWETRLESLEADVKEIKTMLQAQQKPEEPWWESVVGAFADDPVYAEIRRLTEEISEKERRKARRTRPKKKTRSVGD
jgi:hypothetical protein